MPVTTDQIIAVLIILALTLVVLVLYHLLFVAVDLRKVMRRVSNVSEQVEQVIVKPLEVADQVVEGVISFFQGMHKTGSKVIHKRRKVGDSDED